MDKKLQYPQNLIVAIFGENKDFDEAGLEYALNTLSKRNKEIMVQRYKEEMTLMEIGYKHDVSYNRIIQIIAQIIRKLHKDGSVQYIELGVDEVKRKEKRKEKEQMEQEQAHKKSLYGTQDCEIEELNFPTRAYNCLKRANLNTRWDIIDHYYEHGGFYRVRNLGALTTIKILDKVMRFKNDN